MNFRVIKDDAWVDAIVINSYGRVGIGEPNPIRKVHIGGASGSDSTLLLHMDADTAGGECGIEFKADSTNDDRRIKAAIKYRRDDPGTRGTGNLHFCVNGDNNDVNVSTSHSRMMLNTDGLHFNGDTAAANALDDYEEGTWTPTANGGFSSCTISGTFSYTKIGNTVFIRGYAEINGTGTGSGSLSIAGLPFTSNSGTSYRSAVCLHMNKLATSVDGYVSGLVYHNSDIIYIREGGLTGDGAGLADYIDAGTDFYLSGQYIV